MGTRQQNNPVWFVDSLRDRRLKGQEKGITGTGKKGEEGGPSPATQASHYLYYLKNCENPDLELINNNSSSVCFKTTGTFEKWAPYVYVDPISAALSVLSGEDRGLISRTAAGNRAFPSDDVFLSEHNDFYYDIRSLFCQRARFSSSV